MPITPAQYRAAEYIQEQIDKVLGDSAGDVVQAEDMLRLSHAHLIPSRPELHTATTYATVLRLADLEVDENGDWYAPLVKRTR